MDLEFTRGDTQVLKFQLKNGLGKEIEPSPEDNIYFTLNSEDTSDMPYGTYQYDIELKSGDYVKTLGFGTITLTEEITHRRDE